MALFMACFFYCDDVKCTWHTLYIWPHPLLYPPSQHPPKVRVNLSSIGIFLNCGCSSLKHLRPHPQMFSLIWRQLIFSAFWPPVQTKTHYGSEKSFSKHHPRWRSVKIVKTGCCFFVCVSKIYVFSSSTAPYTCFWLYSWGISHNNLWHDISISPGLTGSCESHHFSIFHVDDDIFESIVWVDSIFCFSAFKSIDIHVDRVSV